MSDTAEDSLDLRKKIVLLALESVGLKLPQQNPLDQFVHNNLLMPFEKEPFWEGVHQASLLYQGAPTKGINWYFAKWKKGLLSSSAVEHAALSFVRAHPDVPEGQTELWAKGLAVALMKGPDLFKTTSSHARSDTGATPIPWPAEVYEWLCKVAETYLDQGMAPWKLEKDKNILHFARTLLKPFASFDGSWQKALWVRLGSLGPSSLEDFALEGIHLEGSTATSKDWEAWFLRLGFSLRGWSGMIHRMSQDPEIFLRPCPANLADWLFLLHLLALQFRFSPLPFSKRDSKEVQPPCSSPGEPKALDAFVANLHRDMAAKIWHEAFEWSSYQKIVRKILQNQMGRNRTYLAGLGDHRPGHQTLSRPVQALFCIDDREESLRRHLEEVLPSVKTYGVLGHFGIDMAYVRPHHPRPLQHCPPVMKPRRVLVSTPLTPCAKDRKKGGRLPALAGRSFKLSSMSYYHFYGSKTIGGGVASAIFLGQIIAFLLLVKGFIPSVIHRFFDGFYHAIIGKNRHVQDGIDLERKDHPVYGPCGYTLEEQADIVEQVFRQAGLPLQSLADLIVVMGHTSTSANNPFQKAYGCGACAGNSGGVNARVFAAMLNDSGVRSVLEKRGALIPPQTVAVSAVHDTSRETVTFYKHEKNYTNREMNQIEEFERHCLRALDLNASERAPHLGLSVGSPGKGLPYKGRHLRRKIEQRSLDIAQIRAEFGHSQTYYAYFGPRSSTRGLCLARQSFLISYDPSQDQNGAVLRELIHGALPVVANITLDYFFSAMDPRGFGSANKVPLNVSAMIGLIQGSRGDLQVGLAEQMVEIHDPVRPMVFIEAPQSWIKDAVLDHPRILRLIKHDWIRLVQVCGNGGGLKLLTPQVSWQDMSQFPVSLS